MNKWIGPLSRLRDSWYEDQYSDLDIEHDDDIETLAKQLKALDIIIDKGVDMAWFSHRVKSETIHFDDALDIYNCCKKNEYRLTQEEFDLLKEVLCDERR